VLRARFGTTSHLCQPLCVADTIIRVHNANMTCEVPCHGNEKTAANSGQEISRRTSPTTIGTSQRMLPASGGICYRQHAKSTCKRHHKSSFKNHTKRHAHFLYNYLTTDVKLWRQAVHVCVHTPYAKAKRKTPNEAYEVCRSSA
jgi:hypothetical protein